MSTHSTNEPLLEMFIFEYAQLINQLEEQILMNEKMNDYSDSAVNEIFRIMHTLKGSSAMMGFDNISALAHCMEDLFYCIRNGDGEEINPKHLADILLDCVDFLAVEELKIRSGHPLDGTNQELIDKINGLIPDSKITKKQIQSDDTNEILLSPFLYEQEEIQEIRYYCAHIYFEEGITMENMHAYSIVHKLKGVKKAVYYYPSDIAENEASSEVIIRDGFLLYIKSDCTYETMEQILKKSLFVKEIELLQLQNEEEFLKKINIHLQEEGETMEYGSNHREAVEEEAVTDTDRLSCLQGDRKLLHSQQSLISVNVAKLDKLMDLVGEMVIAEAMVLQNADLAGLTLNNFKKAAHHLNKITTEVQDMVMSIRMVPLSATFLKMHRIVRDMNKKLSKETELIIVGEDTEVDKNIIEHISDPLMHLVRNSVDHGIETPEERISKGKMKQGTIVIEAKHSGSDVVIQIRDDGRGLNRERILKRAKENHLLTQPETELTNRELYNMILLPGFSTKEKITEYSGRGVGMDVVSSNIESVGGSVAVDSIPEQGTSITLKIPLTLAIIDGMNIKVGKSYYTLPTTNVKEFFKPKGKDIIIDPNGNEMIMVRGQCYPILKLYDLFKVTGAKSEFSDGIMIMVEEDGTIICIFADDLLGQQQVVVKSLPNYMGTSKKVHGLSGCTLLGNGEISLIIDITALTK